MAQDYPGRGRKRPSPDYEPEDAPIPKRPKVYTRWKNECGFAPPHKYFRELILGASDTGKSTYIRHIVKVEHHLYDQIVLIGPHVLDERYGLKSIIEDTGKVRKIYLDFDDPEVSNRFYQFIDESSAKGLDTLVIVDDPIGIRHFVKGINQSSRWNMLFTGVKQKRVAIKFSTQGELGLAPICRGQCDRIVRYPDYTDAVTMLKWCAIMNDKRRFVNLIERYTKSHHALVICKFRGMRALHWINPEMKVSPIEDA